MTLPDRLQSSLAKGEAVLWDAKPEAPRKLSAYKGWHEWVARGFFAISALATLLILTNRGETAQIGLSWSMIIFVGGPILAGLVFRFGFAWVARDAMRQLHYAVTDSRILIQTKSKPMSFTITADTPVEVIKGRKDKDVLRFTDIGQFRYVDAHEIDPTVYRAPKGMVLPTTEAAAASAAINSVKATK